MMHVVMKVIPGPIHQTPSAAPPKARESIADSLQKVHKLLLEHQDWDSAFNLLEMICNSDPKTFSDIENLAEAQYQFGCHHTVGSAKRDIDEATAKMWFQTAANNGHKKAQTRLELDALPDRSTKLVSFDKKVENACQLLHDVKGQDAASKRATYLKVLTLISVIDYQLPTYKATDAISELACQSKISQCYGHSEEKRIEGLKKIATEEGHPKAQYRLGLSLGGNPIGTENLSEALKWMHCAVNQSYEPAIEHFGELLTSIVNRLAKTYTCNSEHDPAGAKKVFEDLSKKGFKPAQEYITLLNEECVRDEKLSTFYKN